jgi:dihydrofolate reductase
MRKLVASTFVSLDGVMQAPGGPDEDPSGGFAFGGWTFPYFDDAMDPGDAGFDGHGRDLVLGRRTYEIFEAYWPYQEDPTAHELNAAKKYVASRTLATVGWNNSELLGGDAAAAVAALKKTPGRDLQTIGSAGLLQSLQAAGLIDEFNVWTFPVVLGRGKRLFEATAKPGALRLVHTKTSATGVVMSRYVPDGEVRRGSFAQTGPSAKELARREQLAREDARAKS